MLTQTEFLQHINVTGKHNLWWILLNLRAYNVTRVLKNKVYNTDQKLLVWPTCAHCHHAAQMYKNAYFSALFIRWPPIYCIENKNLCTWYVMHLCFICRGRLRMCLSNVPFSMYSTCTFNSPIQTASPLFHRPSFFFSMRMRHGLRLQVSYHLACYLQSHQNLSLKKDIFSQFNIVRSSKKIFKNAMTLGQNLKTNKIVRFKGSLEIGNCTHNSHKELAWQTSKFVLLRFFFLLWLYPCLLNFRFWKHSGFRGWISHWFHVAKWNWFCQLNLFKIVYIYTV